MRLPDKHLGDWASEVIEECYASREQRQSLNKMYKSYYFTGTGDDSPCFYNRCFPHIDRLRSVLFSPADVRFAIEFDEAEPKDVHDIARAATRYLNKEWHRCDLDVAFAGGVDLSLYKGCSIFKQIWGHDGLEGWLVHPEFFGVLREDIADLDRQEAFVHSTYLTHSSFRRTILEHPDYNEIMEKLDQYSFDASKEQDMDEDYFHQVIIGGTNPVSTTTSTGSGIAGITGMPTPMLDRKVATRLVRLDELWVMDDERQDYTTIRMIKPDIVIEGKYRRRNLSGLADELGNTPDEMRGIHPFTKICPNEIDGYFWGQSEIANIYRLQDDLNDQLRDLRRLGRLRGDPPRSMTGFSGINAEKYKAFRRPGGFISEENPNAKIQEHAPEIPEEIFTRLDKTISYFDDVAGFNPIMMGQGEPGVRAGSHAMTLARNASPRMRDRALLVERQCVDAGAFSFAMLQAKKAEVFDTETGNKFLLGQLPDDARVTVDSHTSSPVFMEDAKQLAFSLHKAGAIDASDLIALTHPPREDNLVMRARERAKAQAEFAAKHPELLSKGKSKAPKA